VVRVLIDSRFDLRWITKDIRREFGENLQPKA
jgi:hypothetical protein